MNGQQTLDIVFAFVGDGSFNHAFIKVGPSSGWVCFLPKRIREFLESMMGSPFLSINIFFFFYRFPFSLQWLWSGHSEPYGNPSFTTAFGKLGLYQSLPLLVWVQKRCVVFNTLPPYFLNPNRVLLFQLGGRVWSSLGMDPRCLRSIRIVRSTSRNNLSNYTPYWGGLCHYLQHRFGEA